MTVEIPHRVLIAALVVSVAALATVTTLLVTGDEEDSGDAQAIQDSALGPKSLDTDDLESDLAAQVAPELGVDTVEVSCPDDVEVEAGSTFDCDVSAAGAPGQEATVEVELTDDEGTYVPRLTP